jgi:hypothetical protein
MKKGGKEGEEVTVKERVVKGERGGKETSFPLLNHRSRRRSSSFLGSRAWRRRWKRTR